MASRWSAVTEILTSSRDDINGFKIFAAPERACAAWLGVRLLVGITNGENEKINASRIRITLYLMIRPLRQKRFLLGLFADVGDWFGIIMTVLLFVVYEASRW